MPVAAARRGAAGDRAGAADAQPPAPTSQRRSRETRLRLELTNDSWVEVYDSRGERLFYDVASAGSVQSVEGRGAVARGARQRRRRDRRRSTGRRARFPPSAIDGEGARFVVNRSGSLVARPLTVQYNDEPQHPAGHRHERRPRRRHRRVAARRTHARAPCMDAYGYEEIRVPVVEHTELFKRAIGEYTDVVEKEMYTFTDQGGDSLTLRPEATAGIVRAAISNGLLRGARLKLWCQGPMFRHEKPQKGRFRQFNQVDLEAIGFAGPGRRHRDHRADRAPVEVVRHHAREAADQLARHARVAQGLSRAAAGLFSRDTSTRSMKTASAASRAIRCASSTANIRRRRPSSATRRCSPITSTPSRRHTSRELRAGLDALGIPYTVNPRLVRGLDYYSRTVFEWITDALGSQDAICSGGRYDGLIAQMGGEPTPAIGFAMGVERVVELVRLAGQAARRPARPTCSSWRRAIPPSAPRWRWPRSLRDALPGRGIVVHCGSAKFKTQFRRADESGARLALIVGDDELARGVVALKPLRGAESTQTEHPDRGARRAGRRVFEEIDVSEYSEAEQWERAKDWLKTNGIWIVAGIAIGARRPGRLALVPGAPRHAGGNRLGALRGTASTPSRATTRTRGMTLLERAEP